MSDILHQRLIKIRESVETVLEKNRSLEVDNVLLMAENEGLKKTIELQKNALSELKEENKLIKLAKEMSGSISDAHDLKIKINELVKDIDRCIELLNE